VSEAPAGGGGVRTGTKVSDYDYPLPTDLIARYPVERRDRSRLLEVSRDGGLLDRTFDQLPDLMSAGDVLVVNESRVLPARLLGRKPTGAHAEILLLRPVPGAGAFDDAVEWEALVRPGAKLKPGRVVQVADDLRVDILESIEGGGRIVRLVTSLPASKAIRKHGHMPLPPYIDREDEGFDRERYQTVYATTPGSVAAPTAGLHFTEELLSRLSDRGVARHAVVLDVGVGTFRPVEADDPAEHVMHFESYTVPASTADAVNAAKREGRRVWAIGTTVVRTLESAWRCDGLRRDGGSVPPGRVVPGGGRTDLFIRPPYTFQVVDALVTNFHLPRSTLMMLVAAFCGYDRVMGAYGHAVDAGYRFYSYGDAMVISGA
jgi:S-adenosylmethionine:tRNA ribosyltransferase-isomerase